MYVLLLAGARTAGAQERFEFTEIHMAMPVRLVLFASHDSTARSAARHAFARIASLEGTMSDYRSQSELRQLQRDAGEWRVIDSDLFAVLARARAVAKASNGAFDFTVGLLVAIWREARATGRVPSTVAMSSALARTGWNRVQVDSSACAVRIEPGTSLDLGGVAKGYILQQALHALRERGVTRALLEAGGDIVVGDAPPGAAGWRVEVPGANTAVANKAASLANAALATSGPAAQFVEIDGRRYSHVIDPRTGWALTSSTTAYVIASDAAMADALATALTVLDLPEHAAVLATFPDALASVQHR